MFFGAHGTSLPVPTNSVSLDPSLKDAWGLPAVRVTYKDHPDDLKNAAFLTSKAMELAEAAGALKAWPEPIAPQTNSVHLLGTCRMGNDPQDIGRRSVQPDARCEEPVHLRRQQPGHFLARAADDDDLALAFRAGENIASFAKRGEI